jgi:hypothetical protein
MSLLQSLFRKDHDPIRSYDDFWKWFQGNERTFFKVVKEQKNIEKGFFDKLSPKLQDLKGGIFFLTGMHDEKTVDLILTPDGNIKNIVFVEELVKAAPKIEGWKITALKPATDIGNLSIAMGGHEFTKDNLNFYSNDNAEFPDEIDITVVHPDLDEENASRITNGVYIFLDNFLGELEFVTTIDNITVIAKDKAKKELIPIEKLKDFLIWRQKEFIEKYEGIRHNTESDSYSGFEAELPSGNKLLAVINTELLNWNAKASHPWILTVEIKYDGEKNKGMPDDKTYKLLDEIESEISDELKDFEGFLNIGRQTAENLREIYFACKDFRKPSKVLHDIADHYSHIVEMDYEIYMDKYWRTFNRFSGR